MSDDPQDNLDLFDDHEEVVSENGKKVTRRGIYLLPNLLTTASSNHPANPVGLSSHF